MPDRDRSLVEHFHTITSRHMHRPRTAGMQRRGHRTTANSREPALANAHSLGAPRPAGARASRRAPAHRPRAERPWSERMAAAPGLPRAPGSRSGSHAATGGVTAALRQPRVDRSVAARRNSSVASIRRPCPSCTVLTPALRSAAGERSCVAAAWWLHASRREPLQMRRPPRCPPAAVRRGAHESTSTSRSPTRRRGVRVGHPVPEPGAVVDESALETGKGQARASFDRGSPSPPDSPACKAKPRCACLPPTCWTIRRSSPASTPARRDRPRRRSQVRMPVGTTGGSFTVLGGGTGIVPGTSRAVRNTHSVRPSGRAAERLTRAGHPLE
jgi:hypothetical protein